MDPQVEERQEVETRSTVGGVPVREGATRQVYSRRAAVQPGYRPVQLVWLAVGVVDGVLAIDFIFKILAAHAVGFVGFINAVAGALSVPFSGVFSTATATGHVVRWADIIAIVVWTFAAWVVVRLITIASTPRMSTGRTVPGDGPSV